LLANIGGEAMVAKHPPREDETSVTISAPAALRQASTRRGAITLTAAKHLPEREDQGDVNGKASARAATTTKYP
jgi:hypothetical protein